jgi:hypothetical protein
MAQDGTEPGTKAAFALPGTWGLLGVLITFLTAMPWSCQNPNHLFMLKLLRSQLGDESAKSNDSLSNGETGADREHGQHEG